METFYRPSLEAIVEAIQKQRQTATGPISVRVYTSYTHVAQLTIAQTIFLVGGFAASPWLYNNLQQVVKPLGLTVCRPDTHTYVYYSSVMLNVPFTLPI